MAGRLRQNATQPPKRYERVPSFAFEHHVAGDLGHIHAAHDLRMLPLTARPGPFRPLVLRLRLLLRRGLYPLPESQSVWNGANARIVSFLVKQLAAHARALESLEQRVAELQKRDE